MMEGFEMVETPYILLLDGDGTYAPADADLMLMPLFNGFDHVIGNRLIHAEEGAFSRLNLLGNYLLNHLFKFAHSRDLQDILSGYRALSKAAISQMHLTEIGFEIETEVSVEAVRNNHRIKVVPVTYRKRPGTDTKLNPLHDGYKIAVTIYRLAKMNNPIFYFGIIGAILSIIGFLTGIVVVVEWLNGITHLPLAVLTVLLIMVGVEIFMFGVLSDMILAYHREMMNEIQRINPEIPNRE
jgi:dolichol-phosphate mannosyltransferase